MPQHRAAPSARHEIRRRAKHLTEQAQYHAWELTTEGRTNSRRVLGLRNSLKGRRCFVMGNGPSLLKCDLNRLASEATIVSNAHYLIWDQLQYVPTMLTVEDRLVAEDRGAELSEIKGIKKVYPFDLRRHFGEAGEETLYLNFQRSYQPFPKFSDNLARRAYWGGTVSFLNLQLAAYMGANPIVLIGFDHSYRLPERETGGSVITSEEKDVNHIHPDYFGPGYRWHDPAVSRMETSYRLARSELERRGMKVINATVGGQLEVFERASFEELV